MDQSALKPEFQVKHEDEGSIIMRLNPAIILKIEKGKTVKIAVPNRLEPGQLLWREFSPEEALAMMPEIGKRLRTYKELYRALGTRAGVEGVVSPPGDVKPT
jgi:hypothetical protein